MTIRLSSGLRDAVVSSRGVGAALAGGHLLIYAGPQPADASSPPTGALLARVTQDGAAVPGLGGLKLKLGSGFGEIVNDGAWVLRGVSDGTPGWWRFVGAATDTGAHSNLLYRLDGTVAECVTGMPESIASDMNLLVAGFLLSIPNN